MSMPLISSPPPQTHLPSLFLSPSLNTKSQFTTTIKPSLSFKSQKYPFSLLTSWAIDNGSGSTLTVEEDKAPEASVKEEEPKVETLGSNGSPLTVAAEAPTTEVVVPKFKDPRWVNGTWDLSQFQVNGKTNWDAVIDAEARRRKLLEQYPESSNNEDPVVFDTSIVPWWAWIKRYHLPEAELLNGRAAMIGFFMAYFVDSLTGVGLVDQTSNFFCKTLLLVAVVGVLLIRKNEDIDNLKKLLDESTFYDKQWQATWQDESSSSSKKDL